MNNMTVGMENLPNVFIDKIEVRPISIMGMLMSYKIIIKMCMYDHAPKRSWYDHQALQNLRVKLAFRGGEAALPLDNGQASLYDINEFFVKVENAQEFEIEEEFDKFSKFTKTVELEVPSGVQDLNVYVACFIDDLSFPFEVFNKFYGPMSAERVFVAGEINEQSGYFYYPITNEVYAGPVHTHEGVYMEGSMHTPTPHETVLYVIEDNNKIRVPEFADAVSGDVDPTLPEADQLETQTSESSEFDGAEEGDPATPQDLSQATLATPDGASVQAGLVRADEVGSTALQGQGYDSFQQAQDLLADVSFEIRDAIRRGIY